MDGREDGPFRHYRGEKGSEVMDGSEEGPFRFRHYGGRREVKLWMVVRRVLSLSDTMGEGGK